MPRTTLCNVQVPTWIALAALVAPAISAAVAVIQARRATKAKDAAQLHEAKAEQNAARATKAAEEAAAWQRQAAAAAQRSAEALEAQNRMAEEHAERAEGVPWELRHAQGDQYDLWNVTDTAKFGVKISGGGVAGDPVFDRVDGRSSARFMIAPFGGEADRIDVTWHRRDDLSDQPPQQWRGTRPPKL